ncbi:hypothetical protein JOC93_003723 [Priestia taiwanensis]|nr:hypothetical protein [Priestia taiwanensis]
MLLDYKNESVQPVLKCLKFKDNYRAFRNILSAVP